MTCSWQNKTTCEIGKYGVVVVALDNPETPIDGTKALDTN